jgi:hypothetical protein
MNLILTFEERNLCVRLLEHALYDLQVEIQRARKPQWQEQLRADETLTRHVLERLKTLGQ